MRECPNVYDIVLVVRHLIGYNKFILAKQKPMEQKKPKTDYSFALLAVLIFLVFILLLV